MNLPDTRRDFSPGYEVPKYSGRTPMKPIDYFMNSDRHTNIFKSQGLVNHNEAKDAAAAQRRELMLRASRNFATINTRSLRDVNPVDPHYQYPGHSEMGKIPKDTRDYPLHDFSGSKVDKRNISARKLRDMESQL